jgi:hypothetical protein
MAMFGVHVAAGMKYWTGLAKDNIFMIPESREFKSANHSSGCWLDHGCPSCFQKVCFELKPTIYMNPKIHG